LNSVLERLRGVGTAAGIALAAAAIQGLRLPAVLDGPGLEAVTGRAPDPHLPAGLLDGWIATHCALSAPCVQHANLAIFAALVFLVAALAGRSLLGLLATAVIAISPLASALVVDPLGAAASIGVALVALGAIDVAGTVRYPLAARCLLAIAIALADPALVPAALAYGAFGGLVPLACAIAASAARFFIYRPVVDPLAAPATLVAFGFCLFVGGPLLMLAVRHRAFRVLDRDGHALLRTAGLAIAALAGGVLAPSGDVAPYWLAAEAALLAGLVASLPFVPGSRAFERSAYALGGLLAVQFVLFIQYHQDVTTAAIAYRGDDLRGMLAASDRPACVADDEIARRYVLANGAFLRLYPPHVAPVTTADPATCLTMPDATAVVTMAGLAVHDWGGAVPLMKAYRDAADPDGTLQIEGGAVTPATHANTPTGRGSFGNQIDTPLGHVGDFTILSGYTYVPACVPVGAVKHLVFAAASIPGTPPLRLRVDATSAGSKRAVLDATFPSSPADAPYRWIRYDVPLAPSDCASLAFSVANEAHRTGDWLTIAGAAIR
jgi:hypothetical protein